MSNKILNLDLSKDPIMPAIVYGRVGDDRLQTVTVNLTRRDEVADLTGYDITFEGTTHNGQTKVFDSNNVSSTAAGLKKGTFEYTFPNMAFAVAGKYEQAYFSIVKDGKRDSTAGFEIYVDGNADIDAPEAETIITEYNKLLEELKLLQDQALADFKGSIDAELSSFELSLDYLKNDSIEMGIELGTLTKRMGDLQSQMDSIIANGAMTKQQADTYYMKAGLPAVTDQDWNEIKTIGSYSVEGATGSNPPKQNAWGTLLVLGKSDSSWQKTQLFVSAIDMWFRRFDGSNWQDWSQAGSNFKAATPEEIISGQRDDVVVTPKGLKEASKQTKLKAYFDAGDYPRNITTTPYFIPFGPILKDNNDELSSPAYVRNSNGSVSFLRDMTIMITINCKILIGDSSPSDHVFISVVVNDNPTPNNIISQGSTGATNGVMRYDWNQMGNCILSVKAGDFIGISINHIQNGKKVSGVQITTAVIEEI